jgi:DNA-binding NarL/FixJ family response regulator
MSMKIVLADDHRVVREGLKALLVGQGFDVVGEAPDGREALRQVEHHQPDIAVLDLSMPQLNGVDAARTIVRRWPRTRTLLLTIHSEDPYVIDALRAGVRGYVLKTQAGTELAEAIREVGLGGVYLSPGISRAVVNASLGEGETPPDPLSPREREVLQLVAEGKPNKQIASDLGISVKTVESHRSRLTQKLDIHDTAGLVRYAIRQGMVSP